MDPANYREALREAAADEAEGESSGGTSHFHFMSFVTLSDYLPMSDDFFWHSRASARTQVAQPCRFGLQLSPCGWGGGGHRQQRLLWCKQQAISDTSEHC